jgi:hypothetical protein
MKFKCPQCGCIQFFLTYNTTDVLRTDELFEFNPITWREDKYYEEYSLQCAGCKKCWSIQPTIEEVKDECLRLKVLK